MRVGLVCPYSFDSPGGVQNHVLGIARELARAGHQPHILAPGELGPPLTSPESGLLRQPSSACRCRLGPLSGEAVEFTSAGQAMAVPYNGSIARVNFGPLSAARVRRWLRAGQFDLVHIHEPITPSIALLALWAADVPVVVTFHTATPRSRSMQLAGGALRAAIEKIDAGIAVSESARRVVVQHLGRDAVVIPNGFDFAAFDHVRSVSSRQPLEKWARVTDLPGVSLSLGPTFRGGEGARPRVMFLGRVDEPRKGLDVLLAALPAIRAGLGDVDLVVAGQGSIALPPGVRMVGAVSDETKVDLLAGSDVFVAPHRDRESFGIVLLEAMASGAPVVASALPAFADVLRPAGSDEALGELVPVGDSDALAGAVIATVRRPQPDRVQRARDHARRFDWSRVAPAITAVYRAALASTAPTLRRASGPIRPRLEGASER
jgi:phosphatidyl-myo-inositol alpha-mannosyltransferase